MIENDIIELARQPLIEAIKDLENQVRILRKEKTAARNKAASLEGIIHGILCPGTDSGHVMELLELVGSEHADTSAFAVSEIVTRIIRSNFGGFHGE